MASEALGVGWWDRLAHQPRPTERTERCCLAGRPASAPRSLIGPPGVSQRREALWEYLRGAMWVLPAVSVVLALVLGSVLSKVTVPHGSFARRLVFEGTSDDARTLLIGIAGTMITVIALV